MIKSLIEKTWPYLLVFVVVLGSNVLSWRKGWNDHSTYVNNLSAKKLTKANAEFQAAEVPAATAKQDGEVVYKIVYRDVVKYVKSADHTVCTFDNDAVELRRRAVQAANYIDGFDVAPLQTNGSR